MLSLFTDETHEAYRRSMAEFVAKEVTPHVDEWEEQGEIPRELYHKVGEMGFLGLKFDEAYGGGGGDYIGQAIWIEELAKCGAGGVNAALSAHSEIALPPIAYFGSEDMKQKYLVPGIDGQKVACLAITEPDAGSDVASISTYARKENGHYVVNGTKTFITNGVNADFAVTAVKTIPDSGYQGISLLVIDKDTPGFTVSRKLSKVGWWSSDTAELSFQDCVVPAENLLGEENQGFILIMQNFQWERLTLAIGAVAATDMILQDTISYMKERKQFGRSISSFQALQHRVADHLAALEASRQLCYSALIKYSRGENIAKESTMAKLFVSETTQKIIDDCLQFHGGYGYTMEYPVQRIWRDNRLNKIGGGTTEIMRQILSALYLG